MIFHSILPTKAGVLDSFTYALNIFYQESYPMDEDYTLYQASPGSKYTLTFEVDTNLLNVLRSFEHQNHEFKEGYLESIFTLLYYYQGKPETELFQSFSSNNGGHSIEALIFTVHYYLASLATLGPLLKELGQDEKLIIPLAKSEVNKTNILTVHSIIDRQGQIDHSLLVKKSKEIKPTYLNNFKVCISSGSETALDKETNTLTLDFYKLSLAIRAKGKLDPYAVSHLANALNQGYALELGHVLLHFAQNVKSATENYDDRFISIAKGMRDYKFTKEKFLGYRDKSIAFSTVEQYNQNLLEEVTKLVNDIDSEVGKLIIARDAESSKYAEKLLIGLLGHPLQAIRDQSVVMMNVLYDGVDWQRRTPFKPRIATVGSKFILEYLIEAEEGQNPNSIVLLLKSFIFDNKCKQNVVSWHKPRLTEYRFQGQQSGNKRYLVFHMDFGRFKRCGFYDWKLIRLNTSGKLSSIKKIMNLDTLESTTNLQQYERLQESKPVQGRFIVHPRYSAGLQIHELYVDLVDAKPDHQGKFTKRGNFLKVKEKLADYLDSGINCLYLMGALERDNGLAVDSQTQQKSFKRPGVSPMAITCRRSPSTMLGGAQGFKDMIKKAKELNMKILVDSVTRISSARPHNRYKKHLLYKLDKDNKIVVLYGTDGRSLSFEDTTVLNYRKLSVWNQFLEELYHLRDEYQIDGIHLDNSQSWPQIFTLDVEEMFRKENDGQAAYSAKQIFNGLVVLGSSEDSGYWGSSVKDIYPNPFMIKLCKRMWERYPDFFILGEAWGAMGGSEEREQNLIISGVVPRLFRLPIAIASILGENLKTDGTVVSMERQNVNVTMKKLQQSKKEYPPGAILVQSSTYHSWPYPALMYKRGTWAAIDLIFTLDDIPMTFMGEQEGHAFREQTTNFYTTQVSTDAKLLDPTRQTVTKLRKLTRSDSIIQQREDIGFGFNTYETLHQQLINNSPSKLTKADIQKVQSGSSLSQMELCQIEGAQENFRRQVGPQFGFDLKLIGKHYEHRRKIRHDQRVLQKGKLITLSAEHLHGWHTHVLVFARYTKQQLAICAINFNDGQVDLFITLRNLKYYFPDHEQSDVIVRLRDWTNAARDKENEDINYFFIGEFLNEGLDLNLKNFQSQIWGVDILRGDADAQKRAELSSLRRLQMRTSSLTLRTIHSNEIAQRIVVLTTKSKNLQQFVNGYLHFYNQVLNSYHIDINKLLSMMKRFQDDKLLLCNLFAYFKSIIDLKTTIPNIQEVIPYYDSLQQVINQNKLGPICFLCPELGKWTTTGGLGVMVDELTQELAKMNEDVLVISPYYERNKKNETGYLEKDGIKYLKNVDIWVGGQKFTLGVHYGVINGVHLYWLHNPELFPTAYAGEDPKYIIKQLAAFAKGSLETLCQMNVLPSTVVSNDWFCGLVPAYMKDPRFFGKTFDGTKSFHIVHNLDPLYEGRIYPTPQDGTLDYIHELPNEMLIDPYWTNRVVNPSRCALLACDNWGTVSQSYKIELLRDSPLNPVLRKHHNPFAFPNGIRRGMRLQLIIEKTDNDHLKAKEALQKKYFNTTRLMDEYPVFGFVGRITKQKGVHLILEIVEELINWMNGKVHILVGGPADMREEYSAECAIKMQRLRNLYPNNFWADPAAFFMDGTLVNVGCDFGLMPSMFEPGGIVQHEFFIGSTPVIAFKTGGLRDTVHEYDQRSLKGGGFTFEIYNRADFLYAIQRAMAIYKDPVHYNQLRKNAFEAAIDVADVGRAWAQEFYRLFNKNYIDKEFVEGQQKNIDQSFSVDAFTEDASLFVKQEGRVVTKKDQLQNTFEKIISAATKLNLRQQVFTYRTNKIPQPRQIFISGSFDEWKEKHRLKFDHFSKTWNTSLQLSPGEYFYKFYVDNEWVCSENDLKDNDIYGNINNFIVVE